MSLTQADADAELLAMLDEALALGSFELAELIDVELDPVVLPADPKVHLV